MKNCALLCFLAVCFCILAPPLGLSQNNSAYFNGGSDPRIRVSDGNPINPSANPGAYQITGTAITVEAWIYPTGFPDPQNTNCIVQRPISPSGVDPYSIYELNIWHGSGYPRANFVISTGAAGTVMGVSAPDSIQLFRWTHIAVTYDGSAMKMYLNGVLKGYTNATISIGGAGVGLFIGRYGSNRFQGLIDDVRLWNIVRSASDIQKYSAAVLTGTEPGLAGYWRLDSTTTINSTVVTVDQTANHNDLAVQGGASPIAFSRQSSEGATFVLLQPTIDAGTIEYDRPYSLKVPISNTGTGPLAVFSDVGIVLQPSTTDTAVVTVDVSTEGPCLQNYTLASNVGYRIGIFTAQAVIPHDYYDAGNVQSWLMKNGQIATNPYSAGAGLRFPCNSRLYSVYAAGLMIGAKVNNAVRSAAVSYSSEYHPGNAPGGVPANPNNPVFHLYKIRRGDNASSNPDYASWPRSLGAPVNSDGNPALLGDETIWCVYNDFDTTGHSAVFNTQPLGAEVRQTVWGYNQNDVLGNTLFIRFDVMNKGPYAWTDANFSLWADPDLGYYGDDLVGVDVNRDLAYMYNGDDNDEGGYGTHPPAVGFVMLDGAFPQPIRSFASYSNSSDPMLGDPTTAVQLYNYQQGLRRDGSPYIDPSLAAPSTFPFNGDPVAGTGWLDTNPADKRFLLTSGPKTVAPGDSVTITVALVEAQGSDRFASLALLRDAADQIRSFYHQVYRSNKGYALTSITDVASDQGKQVRIRWTAHPLDIANDPHQIVQYEVYRKVDTTLGKQTPKAVTLLPKTTADIPVGEWELAGAVSASQVSNYSLVVPTLRDSTKYRGVYYTDFFVMAHTSDPDLHFESAVDSGYSVDNLSPQIPTGLGGTIVAQTVILHWQGVLDRDLAFYKVYRGTSPDFDPTKMPPLGCTIDTLFTDNSVVTGHTYYYKVSGSDFSGNESGFTLPYQVILSSVSGETQIPDVYRLEQNYPNPFNPSTVIRYALPKASHVSLKVFDVLGKVVAVLLDGKQEQGYHQVQWTALVPSGLYFYRLQAFSTGNPQANDASNSSTQGFVETRKLLLLK